MSHHAVDLPFVREAVKPIERFRAGYDGSRRKKTARFSWENRAVNCSPLDAVLIDRIKIELGIEYLLDTLLGIEQVGS